MKKKVQYIAVCLLFCFTFVGCGKLFQYILIDDAASYTRIAFHEMYEQENIDILFVGSSHCYRSFDPEIFDKELEMVTFNAGTSAQSLDGSYMIIKEAARYNDIKHIYLELYYEIALGMPYKARTEMTQTYIISDYLKPSLDKFQYLLNASTKDYYPNSFIVARRNWSKFFDGDYVKNLIVKKSSDDYKNYEYTYVTGESEWYAGNGYVANKGILKDSDCFSAKGWSSINFDNISEDWFLSLEDIIAFCDKKGISLTLVSAPMSNHLLAGIGNYDKYVELVRGVIAETNVNYYDLNLCKEKFFPNKVSMFKDIDHLNCYGAETFSYLLADFINGNILEKELFYDSYDEKLKNLEPTVFGVSYHDDKNDNGEQVRKCKIISTGNKNLEYKISITPTEGDVCMLQDYSNNIFFNIIPEEHGIITISYRFSDCLDEIWTRKISY